MNKTNTATLLSTLLKETKHGSSLVLEARAFLAIYGLDGFNKRFGTYFKTLKEFNKTFPGIIFPHTLK